MGLFQADAVLKTSIELGLADIRKNPWLIDHIMEDFVKNQYLVDKYGQKQIDACKEWFANNEVEVVMGYRGDKMKPPCVTIMLGPQNEKSDMKTLGDSSTETVTLLPNKIGKPIPYVLKPFTPVGYNDTTGELTVSDSIDLSEVSEGMILVNPANGTGYVIKDLAKNTIVLEPGQEIIATQFGVVPQFQYYEARIEHTFMQASYTVLCTAHGEPQTVIWLHDIVLYAILRYRESLLEALGLAESIISCGDLSINKDIPAQGPEFAWDRPINITGQIEQEFIKSPRRFLEVVAFKEKSNKGSKGYIGGIKILSNLDTADNIDQSNELWVTVEDDDE